MEFLLEVKPMTQQEIYSPTPAIKIIKWYEKVCSACSYATKDYGEYDSVGWWECSQCQRLGTLKPFPFCSAKRCDLFTPSLTVNHEADWWIIIGRMCDKKFKKDLDVHIAHSVTEFNKRMGDYKTGRIV